MQIWQVLPILILAAVFVYFFLMRSRMSGQLADVCRRGAEQLRAEYERTKLNGESKPIVLIGTELRKLSASRIFFAGLTDRRLPVSPIAGAPPRA